MRVFMVSSYPTEGCGISKYTEELLESFIRCGIDAKSMRIFFFKDKWTLLKWAKIIGEMIRDRPNVIHIQYTPPICGFYLPFFLSLSHFIFRGKVKSVITAHEKPSTYYRHLGGLMRPLFKAYEYFVLRSCDALIVHIDEHKLEVMDNYFIDNKKIWVIPHCVMDYVPPDPSITRSFIDKNNLSDRWIVTTLGFIRPSKGIEYLLEAVAKIRYSHDVTLVIAGATTEYNLNYLDRLKELQIQLKIDDIVLFTGHLSDEEVSSLLSISQVVVLPYLYATQSGVLHRSVPYARAIVGTNVGGIGETIQKYNIGELVVPGDSEALAEAILRLLNSPDLSEKYRKNCLKMAEELSQLNIAKMHVVVYNSIIHS